MPILISDECRMKGQVQQAAENAVKKDRDHSRFQAYSNQVYFAADNFPASCTHNIYKINKMDDICEFSAHTNTIFSTITKPIKSQKTSNES